MTEGFVLDGVPAIQFPYLQCNISQLEQLSSEAQTILEQLEQAKKGAAALRVFQTRLYNEQIVRSNVQSIKTTASARYAPYLTDGFDLSAVPIDLFIDFVSFVPIPYLKILAAHDETLRHALELSRGRPLHPQWGTYYSFLMKINTGWAQKLHEEVQAHLLATQSQDQDHVSPDGRQDNHNFNSRRLTQPSAVNVDSCSPHPIIISLSSSTLHSTQHSKPDPAQSSIQEMMYLRAVRAKEREWGPEHPTTLATVMELGCLYAGEGRRSEAETMFFRALLGYEKVEAGRSENPKTQEALIKLEHVRTSLLI